MTDHEMRLRRLEADENIRQEKAVYTVFKDVPYADEAADEFVEDAVLESGSFGDFHGREAIRANLRALRERVSFQFHFKNGQVYDIDLSGEIPTAKSTYIILETLTRWRVPAMNWIKSTANWESTDEGWKVRSTRQRLDRFAMLEDPHGRMESNHE